MFQHQYCPHLIYIMYFSYFELANRLGEDTAASGESEDEFDSPTEDLADDHAPPPQVGKGVTSLLAHTSSSLNLHKGDHLLALLFFNNRIILGLMTFLRVPEAVRRSWHVFFARK